MTSLNLDVEEAALEAQGVNVGMIGPVMPLEQCYLYEYTYTSTTILELKYWQQ